MKVILFGIGTMAINKKSSFWDYLKQNNYADNIVAYSDLNKKIQIKGFENIPFISPDEIQTIEFDKIIMGSTTSSIKLKEYCLNTLHISPDKIDSSFAEYPALARIEFLKEFSSIVKDEKLQGNVAEGGVFEGDFAKIINEYFPDRKLYLFDTFDGFDDRDFEFENIKDNPHIKKETFKSKNLGEKTILGKMPHPQNVKIYKGYFPESAKNVDDTFCFVNLDFDLYKPTLEGLKFFYPKLERFGIILVHDFFNKSYEGAKKAVVKFCKEYNLPYLPIGDRFSVMIVKN